MNKSKNRELLSSFLHYVIPTFFSFTLASVYAIIDGIFVGQSTGDLGLAAINFAYPILALYLAIGTGLGISSAVLYTGYKAKKEEENADKIISFHFLVVFLVGLILLFLLFFYKPLLHIFGARDAVFTYAKSYTKVIIYGGFFQVAGTAFLPLLRAEGESKAAAFSMGMGFVINVVFDYIFVFRLGLALGGAALASVLGQFSVFILTMYFWWQIYKHKYQKNLIEIIRKNINRRLSLKKYLEYAHIFLPPFGLNFSPNLVLIITNLLAFYFGGAKAVAAYTVIAYVLFVLLALLQSISDGSQALITSAFIQADHYALGYIKKLVFYSSIFICFTFSVVLYYRSSIFAHMFGVSDEVTKLIGELRIPYIFAFCILSYLRPVASFLTAQKKVKEASLIVYVELILTILFSISLPFFLGLNGLWWSYFCSGICTSIIYIIRRNKL